LGTVLSTNVARWYIFKPICLNFGRSCNGTWWDFCRHFVYFTAKWNILWPFGTFCGHLVYIGSRFGMLYCEKIWQPCVCGNISGVIVMTTICGDFQNFQPKYYNNFQPKYYNNFQPKYYRFSRKWVILTIIFSCIQIL
jgi:hypothetical protein